MCADAYSPDVVAVLSDESFRSVGEHQYLVHPCKDCFKIGKMPPVAEMLTCARRLRDLELNHLAVQSLSAALVTDPMSVCVSCDTRRIAKEENRISNTVVAQAAARVWQDRLLLNGTGAKAIRRPD